MLAKPYFVSYSVFRNEDAKRGGKEDGSVVLRAVCDAVRDTAEFA